LIIYLLAGDFRFVAQQLNLVVLLARQYSFCLTFGEISFAEAD